MPPRSNSHILMISLDTTLLGAGTLGDARARHIHYGTYVRKLSIIVFSREPVSPLKLSENVWVYSTRSHTRFLAPLDAYRIGKRIAADDPVTLVDTQDPFGTGLGGYMLKRTLRVPLEVHYHGDFRNTPFSLSTPFESRYFLWWARWITTHADGVRVVSSGIRDYLVKTGIPHKRIRVIPTPVNIETFVHTHAAPHSPTVIFVGRLEPVKNLPMLLGVISLVIKREPKTRFLIIGSGGLVEYMHREVEKRGLQQSVELLGGVAPHLLPAHYASADLLVLTSWSESFGKVLVEAGAAGIPVVSTATTGARDIIEDGTTGYLVPVNNASACAEKILLLMHDPVRARAMGRAARAHIERRFHPREAINAVISFWNDLARIAV